MVCRGCWNFYEPFENISTVKTCQKCFKYLCYKCSSKKKENILEKVLENNLEIKKEKKEIISEKNVLLSVIKKQKDK